MSDIQLSGYTVESRLGEGGMGQVFLARRDADGLRVALKSLLPAAGEAERKRLVAEAEVLRRVESPFVPRFLGFVDHPSSPVLIMELVSGEPLDEALDRCAGEAQRAEVLRNALPGVIHGLTALHEAGAVHRDLKPENIMVRRGDGAGVLLDLGLAKTDYMPPLTATGVVVGTPAYMAPEQLSGRRRFDPRTDLYQVGLILLRCLEDAPALDFQKEVQEAVRRSSLPAVPIRGRTRTPSRRLEAVLGRILQSDLAERPPVKAAFRDLLEALDTWPDDRIEDGAGVPAHRDQTMVVASEERANGHTRVERVAPSSRVGLSPRVSIPSRSAGKDAELPPTLRRWITRLVALGVVGGAFLVGLSNWDPEAKKPPSEEARSRFQLIVDGFEERLRMIRLVHLPDGEDPVLIGRGASLEQFRDPLTKVTSSGSAASQVEAHEGEQGRPTNGRMKSKEAWEQARELAGRAALGLLELEARSRSLEPEASTDNGDVLVHRHLRLAVEWLQVELTSDRLVRLESSPSAQGRYLEYCCRLLAAAHRLGCGDSVEALVQAVGDALGETSAVSRALQGTVAAHRGRLKRAATLIEQAAFEVRGQVRHSAESPKRLQVLLRSVYSQVVYVLARALAESGCRSERIAKSILADTLVFFDDLSVPVAIRRGVVASDVEFWLMLVVRQQAFEWAAEHGAPSNTLDGMDRSLVIRLWEPILSDAQRQGRLASLPRKARDLARRESLLPGRGAQEEKPAIDVYRSICEQTWEAVGTSFEAAKDGGEGATVGYQVSQMIASRAIFRSLMRLSNEEVMAHLRYVYTSAQILELRARFGKLLGQERCFYLLEYSGLVRVALSVIESLAPLLAEGVDAQGYRRRIALLVDTADRLLKVLLGVPEARVLVKHLVIDGPNEVLVSADVTEKVDASFEVHAWPVGELLKIVRCSVAGQQAEARRAGRDILQKSLQKMEGMHSPLPLAVRDVAAMTEALRQATRLFMKYNFAPLELGLYDQLQILAKDLSEGHPAVSEEALDLYHWAVLLSADIAFRQEDDARFSDLAEILCSEESQTLMGSRVKSCAYTICRDRIAIQGECN